MHEIDVCEKFLKLPMHGKREFIIAKRLCWRCLKWGHLNSNCRVRKICKVWSEAHPTSLHGDNRKSRSKLATKSKDDSSKPRQELNKVKVSSNEDTTISNCIEVCKTNTYSGPISHSLIVPVWLHHKTNPNRKIMVYALLDEQKRLINQLRQKSSSASDGNKPERKEIEDDGQTNPINKDLKQLVNKSIQATRQEKLSYKPINVDELQDAESEIITIVQNKAFDDEIVLLRHQDPQNIIPPSGDVRNQVRKTVKKSSSIYQLDPFLGKDGILRVGDRIRRASIPENVKHPCILPRKGHVTELVICHHHQKVAHQGRGMTHNNIRSSGFWIIGGRSAVASHISKSGMAKRWSWMTTIFIGVMQLLASPITLRSKEGNGRIPITEHKSANLGDEVILHDPVSHANNKSITWLFNNCRIVQKQPGQEPFVHDKNYQLMDNGDLKILNMTKQLEGEYERLVGHDSTIDVKAKVAIVTDVSSTYKEKITDTVIQKEWNIIFHLSTKRDVNCEAKIDKIALCFKKPDDDQCTNLANATIVSKPGACEATIMFNQTSRNIGLKYYVKFPPIDPFDFRPGSSHEVNSQTFLLTQVTIYLILFHFLNILAPSTEENTTHPITNPPPKSNTVSTITLNPGKKNTEQSLKPTKPTNTLSMTSRVENKYTHQPSTVNTNNQPTDRKCKESCEQTNSDCTKAIIVSTAVTLIVTCAICMYCRHKHLDCRRCCSAKNNSTNTSSTQDITDDTNGNIQMDAFSRENSYTQDIETSE
ncbi:PREDICTED: uncharacterized protein LOC107355480 [Paramuricea clavata]|uniref:PREDICTED: uncharacterized protein LOC107355480 n=1 Tax=Paramuricea clavata TaxID=317549 RepID=A0A6S7GD32_PARCT|nr:PREDICTED: uncharacterized protein LOC107355480 [Paramuricea clavata]